MMMVQQEQAPSCRMRPSELQAHPAHPSPGMRVGMGGAGGLLKPGTTCLLPQPGGRQAIQLPSWSSFQGPWAALESFFGNF